MSINRQALESLVDEFSNTDDYDQSKRIMEDIIQTIIQEFDFNSYSGVDQLCIHNQKGELVRVNVILGNSLCDELLECRNIHQAINKPTLITDLTLATWAMKTCGQSLAPGLIHASNYETFIKLLGNLVICIPILAKLPASHLPQLNTPVEVDVDGARVSGTIIGYSQHRYTENNYYLVDSCGWVKWQQLSVKPSLTN